MRSSGAVNSGLFASVVAFTKAVIALFVGPSFHEGSGLLSASSSALKKFAAGTDVEQALMARISESEMNNVARQTLIFMDPC